MASEKTNDVACHHDSIQVVAETKSIIPTTTTTTTTTRSDTISSEEQARVENKQASPLLVAWTAFISACAAATREDITAFRQTITASKFSQSYPTDTHVVVCISFKPVGEEDVALFVSKNIDGTRVLLSNAKRGRGEECTLSNTRIKKLNILYGMAYGRPFKSLYDFRKPAEDIGDLVEVINVVSKNEETGTIEWNTPNGKATHPFESYDWIVNAPTQIQRRSHVLSILGKDMVEHTARPPPQSSAMKVYVCLNTHSWTRVVHVDGRTKPGKCALKAEPVPCDMSNELPENVRKSTAWKTVTNEAVVGASARKARNTVYILIVVLEDGTPSPFNIQMYAGKAEESVWSRWFGKKTSAHLMCIRNVLSSAATSSTEHHCEYGDNAQLVDIVLAHLWEKHGTWENCAWLFALKSGCENVNTEEMRIITTHNLKNPRFGLNMSL
jgi:hypothetical protein